MARYAYLASLVIAGAMLGAQLLLGPRGSGSVQKTVYFMSMALAIVGTIGTLALAMGWSQSPEAALPWLVPVALVLGGLMTWLLGPEG